MAYTKAADGVAQRGKTNVKVMANDGPKKGIENGPKRSVGGGKTDAKMMAVGRGLAKVAANGKG